MPEIARVQHEWSKDRPRFGQRQVRTPRGLIQGEFYIWETNSIRLQRTVIQIVKSPFRNENGEWITRIQIFSKNAPFAEFDLPLTLVSLYPTKYGEWNTQNCIKRPVNKPIL